MVEQEPNGDEDRRNAQEPSNTVFHCDLLRVAMQKTCLVEVHELAAEVAGLDVEPLRRTRDRREA